MGSSIITVAVFDIHMDKRNDAAINPKRILDGLVPVSSKMRNAMRLCNSHLSMASATKKPPINKKITSLK